MGFMQQYNVSGKPLYIGFRLVDHKRRTELYMSFYARRRM